MKRRGRPPHPDVLTPREWEVLDLVRQGFTNEMIAERLAISERTARFHLSEIMSKLGVESRWEAAAWWQAEMQVQGRRVRLSTFLWAGAVAASLVLAVGLGALAWGVFHSGSGDDGDGGDRTAMDALNESVDRFVATESYTHTVLQNGQAMDQASVSSHTADGREYERGEVYRDGPGHPRFYTHTVEWIWINEDGYRRDCAEIETDCGPWRETLEPVLLGGARAPDIADVAQLAVASEAAFVRDDGAVTHIHGRFDEIEVMDLVFGETGLPSRPDHNLPFDVWIDNATGLPQRMFYGEGLSTTDVYFSDYDAVVIEGPDQFLPAESVEAR